MLSNATTTLAQYAPWLLSIFVKSTLVLLVALGAAKLMRRASASLRHFLYAVTIVGVLLLPLAAALMPSLRLAVLPPQAKRAEPAIAPVVDPHPASASEPQGMKARIRPQQSPTVSRARMEETERKAISKNELSPAPPANAVPERTHQASQLSWQGGLILLWVFGGAIALMRVAIVHLRLRRLVSRAVPVESIALASRLRWLCRDLGIQREVVLLSSSELDVPIAAGVLDPKIVLSPQCGEWTEARRNAVLCHEIAHIKRFDALTQLLASFAAAIHWFNPLIWLVARAMRAERERACDDYVLLAGTAPSEYAHELLAIVSTLVRPQPAAALAMARRSQLEGRVLALVNPRVRHGVLTLGVAMLLGSSVLAVALPLAALKLKERPAEQEMPGMASAGVLPATPETVPTPAVPVSRAFAPQPPSLVASAKEQPSALGIAVYPRAVAGDHTDGRGTVSLVGAHVHSLAATAYFSDDRPEKVLEFYRDHLASYGQVLECTGGRNTKVDVELNEESLTDPRACRSGDFADGGTELKVMSPEGERIVVVRPRASGSEIALVRLPAGVEDVDSGTSQRQVLNSSPDCVEQGSSSTSSSNSSHTDDKGSRTWTATWTRDGCSIEARSSGIVRFNADVTGIESISSGGYFELSERVGDTLRRIRVEPGSNGQLSYSYKLNGNQHEFDGEARAWLSNLLVRLERVTGFAADSRVPALLRKGGPQAVLDEISQLESDYVRQVYFTKMFENATLPAPMLVKALDQARNEISTDYSLAQVLLTIAQRYDLNDEAQRTAFLNGANKLGTDYEHARVLIELLKRPNLSEQIVRGALASAKTIGTDYEKGRILTTLVGLSGFQESEVPSYLDLASSIGTDYEHSRTLMALMEHQKLSPPAVSQVLKSASSIGTDYEKSRILIALSQSHNFDEKQIATYLTLVDSVGTDYERSRDLVSLMEQHKLGNDSVARILAETAKIGTDYEKARVLTEAAGRYEMQGALRDAYIKAADSIGTEYDRNRTLAAITKKEMM